MKIPTDGIKAGIVLLVLLGGCSGQSPESPPAPEVVSDTVVAIVGEAQAVDSLRTSTPAAVDTLAVRLLGEADTLGAPSVMAALDSLHREVARLSTSLEAMRRLNDRILLQQTPPSPPDTAKVENPAELIDKGRARLGQYLGPILLALLAILLTYYFIRGLVWSLEFLAERSARRRLFYKKLIPVLRILAWTFTIYLIIADIFSIEADKLFAASAALGVAIGFAAQDMLKNIFGGILIVLDQPFQVGDKINIGGSYGEVVSIGLRSTRIVTPDDNLVSVPNAQVVDGQVSNANAGALDCQVVVDLYLPGWVDVMKAKSIAYEAAINSKYVYLNKPIVVMVRDVFKETFLTHLKVKAYVLDTRYEFAFASDVTEAAKAEFLREGLLWPVWGLDRAGALATPAAKTPAHTATPPSEAQPES